MRRHDRGFTLIEVMVALLIAMVAVIALSRGAGSGLLLSRRATLLDQAVTRARSHLVAAEQGPLAPGQRDGDDGGGFHWRTSIRALATATPSLFPAPAGPIPSDRRQTLYDVGASLSWKEGSDTKEVSLSTQAIGPAPGAHP
jgi:general secretion pathway protein I